MFIYGALVEHRDEDERADIDAILEGRPLPSEIAAEQARVDAIWELAAQGEIG